MKNLIISIICVLFVFGCGDKEAEAPEVNLDKLTVKEFLYVKGLSSKTRRWCIEDPAKREGLSRCINSSKASGLTQFYSQCYKEGIDTKKCIDEAWDK